MKKLLLFSFCAILLMGCGHFHDDPKLSVWAGGLWIIPLVLALGSIWFFYVAYKASKSGSTKQVKGVGIVSSNENVPIYKIGQFWFGVALAVIDVVVIIYQNTQK